MVCLMSDLMFCFSIVRAIVKMPEYHYVDRKLDVTSHNKDYTSVEQCEISMHATLCSADFLSDSN